MSARKVLTGFLAAAALLTAGCLKPPKYIEYVSEAGDFSAQVPWGWSVYLDRQGDAYYDYTFVGPFEPSFNHGVPTLQVRWYGLNAVHRLPDGELEAYSSPENYIERTLRDVYGAERVMVQDAHAVSVAGWQATHFIVESPMPVPPSLRFGVSTDAQGKNPVVLREHAYVVVPMNTGFYVLIYPATHDGYSKYEKQFNDLVNTFRVMKDGPDGPPVRG
ncbi:MAG: hypothetical protein KGL53_04670 [Elusimicrobia bacterium]|nr:hypothetical protein [Elusimicrobiota bacterium]